MYLNRLKIESTKVICNTSLVIAGFIYLIVLICVFAWWSDGTFEDAMYNFAGFLVISILLLVAFALTFPALMVKKRFYRAEKYNRIFEEDHDGMVPYTALASLTGIPRAKVTSDIRALVQSHILKNITYGWEGAMIIMKADTAGDFISVDCPNCGAPVSMRVNGGARCVHCGTYLKSDSEYVH